MNRERHLRNYNLHSWTGITLGFFVFIVSLTGSFALFDEEIQTWEDPAKRLPVISNPVPVQPLVQGVMDENLNANRTVQFANILMPAEHRPYYEGIFGFRDEDETLHRVDVRWDPATGAEIPERGEGLSTWLLDFHRDLMWPDFLGGRTVGRGLVGIVGVILMLAIISGVVAHTKIFQELFSLRYFKSVRLKWQDTHKVVGLWGLPFFSMISFTGAFLGVIVLLAPITALVAFKGDQQALIDAVVGPQPEATGIAAEMLPLDDFRTYQHPDTGVAPDRIITNLWGDEAATYALYYYDDNELTTFDTVTVSAITGERVYNANLDKKTPGTIASAAIAPLHYGTYGGDKGSVSAIALKLVYLMLGLALSVITAMGNMMWIERRRHGNDGGKSDAFYSRLGRFNVGLTTGVAFASVAIFFMDKLYSGAAAGRMFATGCTYFAAWFVVIVFALVRENEYRTVRDVLTATGIGLIGIPILNGVVTGDVFWTALQSHHTASAWIDIAALIFGMLTIFLARKLPSARPKRDRATPLKQSTKKQTALAPAE